MCGIAGKLNFNNEAVKNDLLVSMANTLIHRGPDGEGYWINEQQNLGFAHRRLSILDLTEAGKQPMHYMNRYTITYNGEIYNYKELRNELVKAGYQFHSETDTEVLLAGYDYYGKSVLNFVDGMFSFALWDDKERELFCARDRFGEKPFYYFRNQNHFLFASEIKTIFTAGVQKEINNKILFYYLAYNIVENPFAINETFYNNIYRLEPGHCLSVSAGGEIKKTQYWKLNITDTGHQLSMDDAAEKFRELFYTSIKRRLRSDVPVGTSLSGGLDSSAIMCAIKKINTGTKEINSFSGRFHDSNLDEGHYIKIVSDYTGYPNHSVYIDENNIEKDLKQICHYQEQPFGSSSIMSQWQVFKLARENNTTVLLDGQGADEVLGGYDWFYYVYLKELFRKNCSEFFKEKRAYENLRQKKQRSFLHTASDIYLSPVFAVLGNINRKIRVPEYLNDLHPDFVALYKNEPVPFDPKRNLNEALYYSATIYGLSKLLRFADRNSMAHSVEVRLPFLYHELVEFCFSLPSEFKQHNGWSKYILRKAIDPYMPNEITWRKNKLGFLPPEKDFLESRVSKNYIADSVNFLKQNKIISAAKPEKNWRYLELNFLLRDA